MCRPKAVLVKRTAVQAARHAALLADDVAACLSQELHSLRHAVDCWLRAFFQSVCDRLAKPIDETTTATATTLHMIVSILCECVMSRLLEAQLCKQRATRLHLPTMSPCVANKGFICCGMPSTSGCVLLSSVGV